MKTLLDLFLGSLSRANPLKRFAWISEPEEIETKGRNRIREIKGEFAEDGVLRLSFDTGIRTEIEAVSFALKNRNYPCERPCQFGFGAQYAFFHYLNYFSEFSKFRFRYDDVFGSRFNLPADFRIFFPKLAFWLEIKSTFPNMSYCRYFVSKHNEYPEYAVCVRVLNEEMTNYEIYGFCTGSDVQKIPREIVCGFPCHEIPVTREYFKPYSDFHKTVLKLPMVEKFDNEHYV
jgi:hypothetical protein